MMNREIHQRAHPTQFRSSVFHFGDNRNLALTSW